MSVRLVVTLLLLGICNFHVASSELIVVPRSVAILEDELFTLQCLAPDWNSTELTYEWQYNPMNYFPQVIVHDCEVNPEFAHLYETERAAEGNCNLNFLVSTYPTAGTYTCQHGFNQGSADVVILKANPACTHDPIGDLIDGQMITMFCLVQFNGSVTPLVTWRSDTGEILTNATTNPYPNQVNSAVDVPVYKPTSRAFTSTTHFTPPIEYTYVWTLPTLYVNYPPENVAIAAVGDSCDQYFANATTLVCTADGYPEPTFWFTDNNSGYTYPGDTLVLEEPGLHQFTCTAANTVRGVNYTAEAQAEVDVLPGPPTPCPTSAVTVDTTTTQSTTTTSALVPVSNCGAILHDAPNGTDLEPGFHLGCYITRDDTAYANYQCSDLLVDLPPDISDADDLLAKGGNFGCTVSIGENFDNMNVACYDDYQHDRKLSDCLNCRQLNVCVRLPPPL